MIFTRTQLRGLQTIHLLSCTADGIKEERSFYLCWCEKITCTWCDEEHVDNHCIVEREVYNEMTWDGILLNFKKNKVRFPIRKMNKETGEFEFDWQLPEKSIGWIPTPESIVVSSEKYLKENNND